MLKRLNDNIPCISLFVFYFLIVIYILFRPILIFPFAISIGFVVMFLHLTKTIKITINTKLLFLVTVLFYLMMSIFNGRLTSADGLLTHLRYTLLLKDHFFISYFDVPTKPYLVELSLAFIYKFGSIYLMNLSFALATVFSLLLTWYLYKRLDLSFEVSILSLLFLSTSPTFLLFAFYEFKPEMFLLVVALLSFHLFLSVLSKKRFYMNCFLLTLLLSLGVLIKVSFFFLAIPLIFAIVLEVLSLAKVSGFLKVFFIFLLSVTFIVPIITWSYFFGLTIPRFENAFYLHLNPLNQKVILDRDPDILALCTKQRFDSDYEEIIYGHSFMQNLAQPLFYINSYKSLYLTFHIGNPGLFLYISFFLFVPLPFFDKRFWYHKQLKYFYFTILATILVFLISISKIYWYLFPIYPLVSIVLPVIFFKTRLFAVQTYFLRVIVYAFCLLHLFIGLGFFILSLQAGYLGFIKNPVISQIFTLNNFVDSINQDKFILDASEHKYLTLYPFLHNSDKRVLRSNYYFVSTKKNLEEIYTDLKSKNIGFILVYREYLLSDWYEGCPRDNNTILSAFLNKYAYPVYPLTGNPTVFTLK